MASKRSQQKVTRKLEDEDADADLEGLKQPLNDVAEEEEPKRNVSINEGDHEKNYKERDKTLDRFTMMKDESEIPATNELLDWRYFLVDFYSCDRQYKEVEDIVEANLEKMIDIRPYIIDTPYLAQSTDRLGKILELFRHMHLRAIAVTNPGTGSLEGIITR